MGCGLDTFTIMGAWRTVTRHRHKVSFAKARFRHAKPGESFYQGYVFKIDGKFQGYVGSLEGVLAWADRRIEETWIGGQS